MRPTQCAMLSFGTVRVFTTSVPCACLSTCSRKQADGNLRSDQLAVSDRSGRQAAAQDAIRHLLQEGAVAFGDDGDGAALGARARRAAHPMDVRAQLRGQVVVDDGLHVANIEAAAGEVGCEQKVGDAVAEVIECLQALQLGEVAVKLGGAEAGQAEKDLDAVCLRGEADEVAGRNPQVIAIGRNRTRGRHLLLGAYEDNGTRLEGTRGQREEDCLALVLARWAQPHKLLLQRRRCDVRWIHLAWAGGEARKGRRSRGRPGSKVES